LIDLRPAWSFAAPPLWYLCLYESLIGRASAIDHLLAERGLVMAAAVMLATILMSWILHRRYAKRIFESEVKVGRSRLHLLERLADTLAANSRESAILTFTLRSMDRMKQHRIIRLVYAGIGCALVLESGIGVILSGALNHGCIQRGAALDAVFALPIALFFFLFTGLRYCFRLPVDLRSNWIFRLTSPDAMLERERAVRLMYFALALFPAIATTAPFFFFVLDPWKAAYGIAFATVIAMLIIESEIQNSDSIPLTCSYLPGKRNILHTGIIYWLTVFALTTVLSGLEALGGENPVRAALVIVMLAAICWRSHDKQNLESPEIRFDDLPEPAVATLGLSRE
jgi:hypothetical protein